MAFPTCDGPRFARRTVVPAGAGDARCAMLAQPGSFRF